MITLIYIIGIIINAYTLRRIVITKPYEVYAFTFLLLISWILVFIGIGSWLYWQGVVLIGRVKKWVNKWVGRD